MLFQKYLKSTKFVKNAASEEERKKFQQTVEFFRTYSDKYDMDYLLMAAQGYQESQLNQDAKSQVGAVGVMQVMPATGKELKVGDIYAARAEHPRRRQVHALHDRPVLRQRADGQVEQGALRLRRLQRRARRGSRACARRRRSGASIPNVWFNNVELVASEKIGRETVTYVANIYKYYIAYKLITEDLDERRKARESVGAKPTP